MKTIYDELPGWEFEAVETTPGGYTVRGVGPYRLEVSFQGNDPEALLARARAAAVEVVRAAEARLRGQSSGADDP